MFKVHIGAEFWFCLTTASVLEAFRTVQWHSASHLRNSRPAAYNHSSEIVALHHTITIQSLYSHYKELIRTVDM